MPTKLKSGMWLGRVRIPGTTKRKTKSFRTKREAMAWERSSKERLNDYSDPEIATLSLIALMEAYLDNVQARLSRKSYYDKRHAFKDALRLLAPSRPACQTRYTDIENALNQIAKAKSGHWANRVRTHLVACWNWGVKAYGLPEPCPWRVDKYKQVSHPRHIPSEKDFWKVHEAAAFIDAGGITAGDSKHLLPARWQQRLLLTLLHTAGRKNEILGLTWDDVAFHQKSIRLWTKKRQGGLEYDLIPMTGQLRTVLMEQQAETAHPKFVFVNPATQNRITHGGKMIQRICKRAGVRPFGFHAIRHLSASLLAKANVPLPTIQAILRHKNANTTSRYLHSLGCMKAQIDHAFERENPHA